MRPLLWTAALVTAGCGWDLDLDFHSEGTAVTATARGDGTTEVHICAGPRDLFTCDDAVGFTVAMDDALVTNDALHEGLFGGRSAYFRGDRPGGTIIVTRDHDGAEMSVELPAPFVVTGPADGTTVTRRDGLSVQLDPPAGDVSWIATATCGAATITTTGEGTTIRGGALPEISGSSCALELLVERRRDGRVDRAFAEDSHIRGVQQRALELRLAP